MKKSIRIITVAVIVLCLVCAFAGCARLSSLFGGDNQNLTSLELCQVELEYNVYKYTGEPVEPVVIAKYSGKVLSLDSDYSVTYEDNLDVGTGKVIVKGIGNYKGEVTLEFEIAPEVYTYNFKCSYPQAYEIAGKSVQNVTDKSQLEFPVISAKGYTFVGWYTLPANPVDTEQADTIPDNGGDIWALFSLNTYTITYVGLDGAKNDPLNPSSYTVEDTVELKAAENKDGQYFAGWHSDAQFNERINTIPLGTTGNITLYAKYISEANNYKLTYIVPDGVDFAEFEYYAPDSVLSAPDILSADKKQEIVWYCDEGYNYRYIFRTMPEEDVTVYGRWEDVLDAGFLDRTEDYSIDSYEELVEYVEYVCFNNITKQSAKSINVTYVSGKTNINSEISKAADECTYPRVGSLSYETLTNSTTIYVTTDLSSIEATVTGTALEDRYPQYEDVLFNPASTRSADYDDFAVNYIKDTFACTTSNQLFYILEHGYRPLPIKGSAAESVYNAYKDIMRTIVDDTMSDYEKVRSIYLWLIENVYYDNYVASNSSSDYYKYKAFYLEGVLEGSAVCDGISKAFTVMCAIEGIDCVRVTGIIDGQNVGHAWNKVQILDGWYLTDATWGNQTFKMQDGSSAEFSVFDYLLFTDEDREADGYVSKNHTRYETVSSADFTKYNVFDAVEMSISGQSVDLLIDSATELSYVFEYLYYECEDESGKTLNIMLNQPAEINNLVSRAYNQMKLRRPLFTASQTPLIFAYGSYVTNSEGEAVGGTTFILIFD